MIIKAVLNTMLFACTMMGFFLLHTVLACLISGNEMEDMPKGAVVVLLFLSFFDAFLLMLANYKWG